MTLASTIQDITTHLGNAWTAVAMRNGTIPSQKNLQNLATAINTLSDGTATIGPWGRVIYFNNSKLYSVALQTQDDFNKVCVTGGETTNITISGSTFAKKTIISFYFGANFPTNIPDNFLYYCSNLIAMNNVPEGVVTIGNNFMGFCKAFNQLLTFPSTLESIGASFMWRALSLSYFPRLQNTKIITLPDNFMRHCKTINQKPSTYLPSTLTSIGNYFMSGCDSFNQEINFSNLDSIGGYFLSNALVFNQDVILTNVKSIGEHFLDNSYIPKNVTISGLNTIGNYFMYNIATNRSIFDITLSFGDFPDNSIGDYFYYGSFSNFSLIINGEIDSIGDDFCANNNGAINITFPTVIRHIGNYFFYGCSGFNNELTFLSSVQTIGNYFLNRCNIFRNANTTMIFSALTSIGIYFMAYTPQCDVTLNFKNSAITEIPNYFLYYGGLKLQTVMLPDTVTSLGTYFMAYCAGFATLLTLPAQLQTISNGFMRNCYANSQTLTIPLTVKTIEAYFLYDNYNLRQLVFNPTNATITASNYNMANTRNYAPAYQNGVKISGPGADSLMTQLPNSSAAQSFRKLIKS